MRRVILRYFTGIKRPKPEVLSPRSSAEVNIYLYMAIYAIQLLSLCRGPANGKICLRILENA